MSWSALVVGDVHLRTDENTDDTVAALDFAAKVAGDRSVDAVLFGGDIYEKTSTPHERAIFARVLRKLLGRPVYGIRGNHDAHEDLEVFNHVPGNTWAEAPTIIQAGPVDLLLVPWPDRAFLAALGHTGEAGDLAGSAALAAMLRAMVATRERRGAPLILNAHLQVLGALSSSAQPLIGKAIEAVLGDLLDLGLTAGFISHVHRPQELAVNLFIPGSVTVHDFGEQDEQKRIGLFAIEDDGHWSIDWLATPCRRWVTIEAGVTNGVAWEHLTPYPYEVPVGIPDEAIAGANVRYRYRCDESEQHLFDDAAIRRQFPGAHTLKIDSEISRADRAREGAARVAAAPTVAEKVQAWGAATGTEITPAHLKKLEQLESEARNA